MSHLWERPVQCDHWMIETKPYWRFGFLKRFRAVAHGYVGSEREPHVRITCLPGTVRWVSGKTAEGADANMRAVIVGYIDGWEKAQEQRVVRNYTKETIGEPYEGEV